MLAIVTATSTSWPESERAKRPMLTQRAWTVIDTASRVALGGSASLAAATRGNPISRQPHIELLAHPDRPLMAYPDRPPSAICSWCSIAPGLGEATTHPNRLEIRPNASAALY